MRIILYAGKGGVGKTSISAATGLELSRRGYKTLVMSVDPAHSLSDAFDMDRRLMDYRQGRIAKVRSNLWIQEVDIQEEIQRHWQEVHRYISALLNVSGLSDVLAEEMAIFPGMEEVSSLLYINQYVREQRFDVILLDCAPTGESLRFVSIPTTLEWYMQKIFTAQRRVARVVRPMLSQITSIPLPGDETFVNIEAVYAQLRGIDRTLIDPRITTVRLVTTPEKMVLKETQRAFMYFCLYGMTVDAVVVNRLLPDQVKDEYFSEWKNQQERYVADVAEMFAPIPVWKLHLFDSEVLGVRDLDRLGKVLYSTLDPAGVYFNSPPYRFTRDETTYQLRMKLPFINESDVQFHQQADELVIRVGNYKGHVALPQRFANRPTLGAKMENGELVISFGKNLATQNGNGRNGKGKKEQEKDKEKAPATRVAPR